MQVTDDERQAAGRFAGKSVLVIAAMVAAGVGVAALVWVLAGPVGAVDRNVAATANALVAPRPWLVEALGTVTTLGADLAAAAVLATLTVVLLLRGRRRTALYVAVAGAGGAVISPILKELVGRLRPVVDAPVAAAPGPSFPSGHTLTATVWVGIVVLVLLPAVSAPTRRAVIGAGVAVVGLVGLTRIGLGVHFLSDVVAGWLLGAMWLAVTAIAFRTWLRADRGGGTALLASPQQQTPVRPWRIAAQLLVVAVLLLGVTLLAGWFVTRTSGGAAVDAWDVAVVRWFVDHRTSELDAASLPVGELGNTTVVIVLGMVAAVLGVAVLRRLRPVVLLAVVLFGELALFIAAAGIIDRPRPPVSHLDAQLPPTASFPSGHLGAAICLYGAVTVLVFAATRAWWRWLVVAAAVAVVVLVALSRLYRGAHHPTDVLGSVLLGVPWLLASAYLLRDGLSRPGARRRAAQSGPASAARSNSTGNGASSRAVSPGANRAVST